MTPKAQSALEYLMIIAITLGIIIPTTYMFFRYSTESNAKLIDSQVNQIGKGIIDAAETVYFSGEGAKVILDINMPKEVEDIDIIARKELVFKLAPPVNAELVFFSHIRVPIISNDTDTRCIDYGNCDLSSLAGVGLKKVQLKSFNDNGILRVNISKS